MSILLLNKLFLQIALFCAAAGLSVILIDVRALKYGNFRSVSFALDLWLSAGLLRLSAQPTWTSIATAAMIVVVRKMVTKSVSFTKVRLKV